MTGAGGLVTVSFRNLGERKGRSVLTGAGIVLGVALFVGALVAAATTDRGISRLSEEAAGQADVIVTTPGGIGTSILSPIENAGLSEADLAGLAELPDVTAVGGVVAFPTALSTPEGRRTTLALNQRLSQAALAGVPIGGDGDGVFPMRVQDGRLPTPGAPELALPDRLADELAVTAGDRLTVSAPTGDHEVFVAGVLAREGVGRLRTVAFTTLETARVLGGRPADNVSFAAVGLAPGTDVDAWVDANEKAVGPGLNVAAAGEVGDRFRAQLAMLSGVMTVLAAAVLFSAGFLIHLTLSMSVVERTRLYGTLHALGATPKQVRRIVVLEAAGMGAVATAVGLGLGVLVAYGLNAATARFLTVVGSPPVHVPAWVLVAGVIFGMVTTVVSSLIPARQAARIEPVSAMRDPHPVAETGLRWRAGAVALIGGAVLLPVSHSLTLQTLALVALLWGSMRLVGPLIRPIAGAVRHLVRRVSPGTGDLAVLHLAKEPTRSAATLALVMVVMAITFATGALTISYVRSLEEEIDRTFTQDLELSAASSFDDGFIAAVEEHPAVAAVSPQSRATTFLVTEDDRDYIYLDVINPDSYFEMAGFLWEDGDDEEVQRLLARGRAVILPAPVAERLDVGRGDEVVLETAQGDLPFEVAATARLSNIPPRLVTGETDGRELFGVTRPIGLAVNVTPGTDVGEAAAALERDLGDRSTFIVSTSDDLRADARAQILGVSNGFFVLLALAGCVGLFGLANTLAVSVIQRGREIAVLRAVGARRRQVGGMAIVEAMTLVLMAFLLAVPLGLLISRPLMDATSAGIGDFDAPYVFPWLMIPVVALIALVVGAIAAAWPARRAAGTEIDLALRFE